MNYEKLIPKLKKYAKSHEKESRFEHTQGVVESIKELAERYGVDPVKAEVVAWMHDTYKPAGPLEHGPMAARKIQEDFGVTDPDILEAIEFHTTGRPGMCDLAKIMKLADMIEPHRVYPEVETIRASVTDNLNESLLMLMTETRRYVLSKGGPYADISNQTIDWLTEELEREKNGQ